MEKYTLRPVSGELFVGRNKLLKEMFAELADPASSEGFCIYGGRRLGKTSLLKELGRRLDERQDVVVVYFSLWEISSLNLKKIVEDLSGEIIREYEKKGLLTVKIGFKRALKGAWEVVAENVGRVEVGGRVESAEFFMGLRERKVEDYAPLVKEVFDLAEEIGEKTATKCVIMLDEFPELLKVEGGIRMVKGIRTAYEGYAHTALVISGSVRKTVDRVALSDTSPFFRMLSTRRLHPLNPDEVEVFLSKYAGIRDKDLARKLHDITGGVPFYLQGLGRVSGFSEPDSALGEFLEEEGTIIFQEEFKSLREPEKRIVTTMAQGRDGPAEIARGAGLETTSAGPYLQNLVLKGVVVKECRGEYRLTDRVFEKWLALNLMERSLSEDLLESLKQAKTLKELYTEFPDHSRPSVRGMVYKLRKRGDVERVGKGKYVAL